MIQKLIDEYKIVFNNKLKKKILDLSKICRILKTAIVMKITSF